MNMKGVDASGGRPAHADLPGHQLTGQALHAVFVQSQVLHEGPVLAAVLLQGVNPDTLDLRRGGVTLKLEDTGVLRGQLDLMRAALLCHA